MDSLFYIGKCENLVYGNWQWLGIGNYWEPIYYKVF